MNLKLFIWSLETSKELLLWWPFFGTTFNTVFANLHCNTMTYSFIFESLNVNIEVFIVNLLKILINCLQFVFNCLHLLLRSFVSWILINCCLTTFLSIVFLWQHLYLKHGKWYRLQTFNFIHSWLVNYAQLFNISCSSILTLTHLKCVALFLLISGVTSLRAPS